MPQHFIVGPQGGKFGMAVRKSRGFQFFAAHDDFAALDGRTFPRAKTLVTEVARHAQKTRRRSSASGARSGDGLW